MNIFILAIAGLIAGSFVNALVWRLEHGLPIALDRSKCPKCKAVLSPLELIPIISWLVLRARCRHCKARISLQYPLVEAAVVLVFVGSYAFWPQNLSQSGQWLLLASWLTASVGLVSLAVYDFIYMILPNRLIYPTLAVAAAGQGAFTVFYADRPLHHLLNWLISVIIASGLFFVIFIISKGKWIGYGDVRLGLITGTILADPAKAWAMLFFGALLGTVVALPGLLRGSKSLSHKLPFGPFLIIGTWIVLLFGQPVLDWYKHLIGA